MKGNAASKVAGTVVTVLMIGVVGGAIAMAHHETSRNITICSKHAYSEDWGVQYRIFAADDPYALRSTGNPDLKQTQTELAAMYDSIQDKTSYRVKIKGYRIRGINMMPDILELEKLPPAEQHPELCTS